MEEVISQVLKKFTSFWYKLYADAMVVILDHKNIPKFLKQLKKQFDKFSLIFNAKKSAITNIRNHLEEHNEEDRLKIPYIN